MKYVISVPIESAHGFQRFTVEAESEDEARETYNLHGGEFLDEEVEVTGLGEIDEICEYTGGDE